MSSSHPIFWKPQLDERVAPARKADLTALVGASKAIERVSSRYRDKRYGLSLGADLPSRGLSMADVLGAHVEIVEWQLKTASAHLAKAVREIEAPGHTHGWARRLGWGMWAIIATTLPRVKWPSFLGGLALGIFFVQQLVLWTPL